MKQAIFYRCMISGDRFYALRTLGYTEGGIGLVKEPTGWVGTHLPTGSKITPYLSKHNTARQALLEAENIIEKREDILETVQKLRDKKGYDAFLVDRCKQIGETDTFQMYENEDKITMGRTMLNKWHDVINEGDSDPTCTRDSWEIPSEGTEIWCTGWKRGQRIKPYGDGVHVIIGIDVYHCDEFMGILDGWVADGYTWGIDGVKMTREQKINGKWERVEVDVK